jgi:hypothetical protein
MAKIDSLIGKIKQKKELSGIDNSIILEHIENYLKKTNLILDNLNESQLKIIAKDIRAVLRENVGRFQASAKDRHKLLETNDIPGLLKMHSSTKERLEFYPEFKEIIKKLKVSSILDLGCGINPIALAEPGVKYYAADINLDDLDLVRLFFKKNNIDGEVFVCNLNKIEDCSLPKTELCLVLKVFDILGKEDYKTAKKIIEKISSKHLIVSFSTRTLSGKPMNRPRRIWFEKLLESLCYKFEIVKSNNEIFYII